MHRVKYLQRVLPTAERAASESYLYMGCFFKKALNEMDDRGRKALGLYFAFSEKDSLFSSQSDMSRRLSSLIVWGIGYSL